ARRHHDAGGFQRPRQAGGEGRGVASGRLLLEWAPLAACCRCRPPCGTDGQAARDTKTKHHALHGGGVLSTLDTGKPFGGHSCGNWITGETMNRNLTYLLSLIGFSILTAALASAAVPKYTVTDLGLLPGGYLSRAWAINASGQVTGEANTFDG